MHLGRDQVKGARILVFGAGRAGRAAALLALRRGAHVLITDRAEEAELARVLGPFERELSTSERARLTYRLGGHDLRDILSVDLVIKSPGVPWTEELVEARRTGVEIIDEVEFASWFLEGTLVAVTGTNGKSTVTALTGALLEGLGRPLFVGGNLGRPLSEAADTEAASPEGLVVAELSSFQLEAIRDLRARVAVLTNVSPDHLDRHESLDQYFAAKANLFLKQKDDDLAAYNADQEECLELVARGPARRLAFSLEGPVSDGAFLRDRRCVFRRDDRDLGDVDLSSYKLVGRHNLQNALAACTAAWAVGVAPERMEPALASFSGLPHRMQFLGEANGVAFYDDSKATNVGAALGSLSGLDRPFVLVAGGRHKGASYEPLRSVLTEKARGIVLLGESADLMARDLSGTAPIQRADSMEEAVRKAAAMAKPGDAVVLCPACSSYDMFRNFEERGRVFAEAVAALGVTLGNS